MKHWKTLSTKMVFKNKWLSLEESKVIAPNGTHGTYTVVVTAPFVVIVVMDDSKVLMVNQHRFTVDKPTLEFPAGGIEENETPLEAAKRELLEETGYQSDDLRLLCMLDDAIGIAKHQAYVFVAKKCSKVTSTSSDEAVDNHQWLELETIEKLINSNEITDTKTIAIFQKIYQLSSH